MPSDPKNIQNQKADCDQRPVDAPRDNSAGLTRRQVLRGVAAGLLFCLTPQAVTAYFKRQRVKGRKRWPKPPRGVHNPRYVHKKKAKAYAASLAPGFYLNPRSQVVHYVSSDKRIARVHKINESRLRPFKPSESTRLMVNGPKPRINLSTASHSLETAALSSLRAKDYSSACQFLVSAIRHDQFFKEATLESPSWRLYDLLAGVSVRFSQQQYFNELLPLARTAQQRLGRPPVRRRVKKASRAGTKQAPHPPGPPHPPRAHRKWKKEHKLAMIKAQAARKVAVLKSRLVKWAAANSPWKRRWLDTKKPVNWMRQPM